MSVSPNPAESSPPLDPSAYRARPLMGPVFWAMVGAVLALVLAGAAGWAAFNFAPGLQRVAQLPIIPPVLIAAADEPPTVERTPAVPAAPAPASPPQDVGELSRRLATLEAAQARTTAAAAAALAAASLAEAAAGSQPFADELAALEAVSPDSPELPALRRLARSGATSRATLAASFPDYAARAASAGRTPDERSGLGQRIGYVLSRVVTLRRVGDVEGEGVDAVLARVESALADGDLDRAMRLLDTLPAAAREAVAPWRARAERRAELDRRVAAVRNRALGDLARLAGPAG